MTPHCNLQSWSTQPILQLCYISVFVPFTILAHCVELWTYHRYEIQIWKKIVSFQGNSVEGVPEGDQVGRHLQVVREPLRAVVVVMECTNDGRKEDRQIGDDQYLIYKLDIHGRDTFEEQFKSKRNR